MIVFTLKMPHRGSWNGRWSGESKIYARVRSNNTVPKDVVGQDFYYTFLPDFDKEFESFKVIIELVDKDGLKTYNQNVEVLKDEKRVQLNNLRAEMTKILDQIDYYKKKEH